MSNTQPTRKRRRDMSDNNATELRKRQALSRGPTESGRLSRDGHQPGPSRTQTRIPTPSPEFSAFTLHAKAANDLCAQNGSFAMPLFVNPNGRSVSRPSLTGIQLIPSVSSMSSLHLQVPNSTVPMMRDCHLPLQSSQHQPMVHPSPSITSGRVTRDAAASAATAVAHTSLPQPHLPRYAPNSFPPSRCVFCYPPPPRPIPSSHLRYPSSASSAAAAGRAEFLPQVLPTSTRVAYGGLHASMQANQGPHQQRPCQSRPTEMTETQARMPLPSVLRTSLWEIPHLHTLSQFSSDPPHYVDVNENQIPSHSRIPFREIEQFNMTMRNTRSVAQRNPSPGLREAFSRFTEGLSHLTESWMERYPGADVENAFVLMPNQMPADLNLIPSISLQNYEALLGLAQRLSEVKSKGLTKSELDQLVIFHYNSNASKSSVTNCVVCMSDFENRQRIRVLGCKHQFHSKCVDKWLKTNRTCPLCRSDALDAKKSPRKKTTREH